MAGVWDDWYTFWQQDSTTHATNASSLVTGGLNIFEVAAGTYGPSQRALRPTAASYENFPRVDAVADTAGLVTATETYVGIYLPKGFVAHSVTFVTGATPANGPTHGFVGLRDSSKVLLASSADTASTARAANTAYTVAFSSDYTTTAAGFYYVTLAAVASTAVATVAGKATRAAVTGLAPTLAATAADTISTSLPATGGALTALAAVPYVYVTSA